MEYIQHFGESSAEYLKFRPDYPKELFNYLASLVKVRDLAWDCGTGNGQVAAQLAHYFKQVIATDINQAQLAVAIKKNNIRYVCVPAEKTELNDSSVDLITVAQALHWFDFEKFSIEVKRVAKPDSIIAAWCYSLGSINPAINAIIEKIYFKILNEYWSLQRKYIDEEYKKIPFPFEKIETPYFCIEKKINFLELIGYLKTWSAVKEYEKRNHVNVVDNIEPELRFAWGDPATKHLMHWPIHLLVGIIKK